MPRVWKTPEQIARDAYIDELDKLFVHITPEQRAFFNRLYPHGLDKMNLHELAQAIGLCQRTIDKNEAKNVEAKTVQPSEPQRAPGSST